MMSSTPSSMQRSHPHFILIFIIRATLLIRWFLGRHSGSEFRLLSQFLTIKVEDDGNRDAECGEASKESTCPFDTQVVEHLAREKREACCCN